ncbi:nicotinate-nucleotide adenylyltransferase [Paenibacillus hamazuiensis]|uniref:nicotinate-nucleotide adenylyltransferase n=1 Tax=Paenibacillus hamazuiensis TaxID=2936508 RepID=UPI00200C83AA|nr:nicotinate-nucleotide adenylyltransferase [Paenibacillus hamazuiensis]
MKVGIMGGTFDPIHIGHLIAAECAREGSGLDEVWFMPSHIPPHKENAPKASPEQRLEMVRRAVAGHPYFRPTDVELAIGGVSYSVDTVTRLQELHPQHRFFYIIGADMVQYLPKWYRIGDIVSSIGFIGLERPGTELRLELLPANIREAVTLVPMSVVDISSTLIRSRKAEGRSVRYFVPDPVNDYIEEKRLYES